MLQHRHDFQHFRVWSGLFLRYSEGSLNPDEAEFQYCKNNLKPYAHFFVALMVNLMVCVNLLKMVCNSLKLFEYIYFFAFRSILFLPPTGHLTVSLLCCPLV